MRDTWKQDESKGNEAVEYWYNPEAGYSARVKFDGCVELFRHFNGDQNWWGLREGDYDNMHICGLKDFMQIIDPLKDLP